MDIVAKKKNKNKSKYKRKQRKKREFIYDWCENGFYSFKSLSQKSVEEILSLFKNNFL